MKIAALCFLFVLCACAEKPPCVQCEDAMMNVASFQMCMDGKDSQNVNDDLSCFGVRQ